MPTPDYDARTYGERYADIYDSLSQNPRDITEAVSLLSELANGGRVLELGIGTGRLALPLRERGIQIEGIDVSPEMLAKLREKPGGRDIPVTTGNFTDMQVDGRFSLVFLVYNTIFALPNQEEQVRCFANVAAHLEPGGRFVLEAIVPDLGRYDRGQRVQATDVDGRSAQIDVALHNVVEQTILSQHIVFRDGELRLYPQQLRYCWPPEMDLMARLAGLRLENRWGGWSKEPFSAASFKHVSVYQAQRR